MFWSPPDRGWLYRLRDRGWSCWTAVLGLLLLLTSGVLACGGGGPPPELVEVSLPPTRAPVDPSVFRYVSGDQRLVFPTDTPVPTITPRPTFSFPGVGDRLTPVPDPGPAAFVKEPSSFWAGRDIPAVSLSCRDRYREMLIAYDGRVPFGPEAAAELSRELVANRQDCLEEGWSPDFDLERVCVTGTVGGVRIRKGLVYSASAWDEPAALGTGRDVDGNMLVHFRKMPLEDTRGCWYYLASDRSWSWFVLGGGRGVDPSIFPACDALLRAVLLEGLSPGTGTLDVARAIDNVRAELGEGCPARLWDLYPRVGGYGSCALDAPTGLSDDGSLVLNWQLAHPASGGALCWVWTPGDGVWREYYESEEVGESGEAS